MYKTIRHGENSLQYKILPQNDDFRIEGKLSTAESSCSSSGRKAAKAKRPKRRSFFAYLGLIFVCTVIVGAVLIPFLVSAECLPNPTEWFLKTKAAFTHSAGKEGRPANETGPLHGGALAQRQQQPQQQLYGNGINVGKTVKIINQDGLQKILIKVNKTAEEAPKNVERVGAPVQPSPSSRLLSVLDTNQQLGQQPQDTAERDATPPPQQPQINEVKEVQIPQEPGVAMPTLAVTTVREQTPDPVETAQQKPPTLFTPSQLQGQPGGGGVNSPHAPSGNSNPQGGSGSNSSAVPAIPTIVTRIIQVPLLKATAKKPMPPTLVKTSNARLPPPPPPPPADTVADVVDEKPPPSGGAGDDINVVPTIVKHNPNSDWIKTHWPYIDPSTYFQWTGYKAEDSVLLPALLGFALIGVILIITVCLVARNKRTIVSSVRRRNRSDVEESGAEDNTTLLNNSTSLSDED